MKKIRLLLLILCLVGLRSVSYGQSEDSLSALVQVLQQADDPQLQLDVLKGLSEGLKGQRGVKMPAGWETLETKLNQSSNPAIRELVRSLSLTFGSANALAELRKQLMDAAAPLDARKNALDSLLGVKDPLLAGLLQQLLKDANLRSAALRGLAAYEDAKTAAAILDIYKSLSVVEKKDALNTLVARASFARPLLTAINSGGISSKDLTADIVRQLSNLHQKDIDEQVAKVWGVARVSSADKVKEAQKYKEMVVAKSNRADDPSRGRAVFARSCGQCHTLFGAGGKVGPDITGSNRADIDYLLHNVIDPNAEIPNDYRATMIEMKDDRSIVGIIKQQDDRAITVVTPNETLLLPRNEIASLKQSEISMMPEGLLQAFTNEEIRDLVAYLRSPKQVPMFATVDNLDNFFNKRDLTGWEGPLEHWRVENGELVGTSPGLKKNEFARAPLLLSDFRLIVKVKLVPNAGNSGIQFRSVPLPDGEMRGPQADIGVGWWGKLYEEGGRGLLVKESGEQWLNKEDWNTYEVLAIGSKVHTAINGHVCVDLDDPMIARDGVVAFQLHSGGAFEVRYKEFQLELNPKPALTTVK